MTQLDDGGAGTGPTRHSAPERAPETTGRLRVLATSDVHSNLLSHDYYSDSPNPGFGLSRTSSLIAAARQEIDAAGGIALLVDNGDWLQGSPLAETDIQSAESVPPAVLAFDLLGYDAVGLGNHEFNFGLETLARALSALPCPALSSNLRILDPTLDLAVRRHLLIERQLPGAGPEAPPVRIGLFSVLPPQTVMWDSDHLMGRAEIDDMVTSARRAIAELRALGADVVIALAHTGLGAEDATEGMENALYPLARLPGLDAAVGGHTHLLLPDESARTAPLPIPVVMPGSAGSHLGLIDLTLTLREGRWQVTTAEAELRAVGRRTATGVEATATEDPRFTTALTTAHLRTRALMAEPVGKSEVTLHSYFTFFGEDRALHLAAAAQAAALRPVLRDAGHGDLPLLSAVAPAKFGGRAGPQNYTDVPAGEMSRRHVADLYIYPNELRCTLVTGAELRDWLEMSASFFNQLLPGASALPLANPDRAGHNFDVVFGVEYEIDPTHPARFDAEGQRLSDGPGRIRSLRWQGAEVTPDQRFAVAFNNYRSSGGGNFRMLAEAPLLPLPPRLVREAVGDYVTGILPPDPIGQSPYPWHFTPHLGVEAVALSGPGARPHLHELPAAVAASATVAPSGFLALHLQL